MKSTFVTLAALAGAATAQNLSDLPQCGQTCVNNMLADSKASELGCSSGDRACLCLNPNFTYGVRDCSQAICSSEEVGNIVDFAINWCSGAGVAITTNGGSASVTRTGEGDSGSATSAAVTTVTGTVSTIYSVYSSDGQETSTPIGTTIIGGGIGGIGGSASSAAGGIVTTISSDGSAIVSTITGGAGAIVTTITSDGSEIVSTITSAGSAASSRASEILESGSSRASEIISGTPTSTPSNGGGNGGDETSGSGGNEPTTSESDGAAVPQKTAAPIGIIAVAGLAAFLL